MKNILYIGLFFISSALFSQNQGSIKGSVTDKMMNNEPLLMANVQIKGKESITQTNFSGNFEISNLSTGSYTLVVSHLGYETTEVIVTVKENEHVNIATKLSPLQFELEDVAGLETTSNDAEDFSLVSEKSLRK